ncbi:glycoside hydrolase family 1 protein [Hortaea werneckii]|nr:glycoside hydrolase family 1 protein [Hortaea werneckii]KAI7485706.1 glycoside hydrolase family 1 protein [Hortaea werneckii]
MSTARLPKDFLWGYATASYQIEGAPQEDGRGDSIWDTFCRIPGKIADGTSGDVACDSYHRYKEDVALLKQLGAKAYRFSISWSRVIPLGGRKDPINEPGLKYYVNLVDELVANGIVPMITLFHWDLPQALYDRYGGFLTKEEYVQDYVNFARVMFGALGSKVKYWITYNEPWCSTILGYSIGQFAPGHTNDRTKSAVGNSAVEPWLAGHNILVSHGAAVKVYREEFQQKDGGQIGITLNGDWVEPWDPNDPEDVEACERKLEFSIAWYADPIYKGDYPASMRKQLGDRLPTFTESERKEVQGSNDFYGMNHYCANYIKHKSTPAEPEDFAGNLELLLQDKNGTWIGPETQSPWLRPNAPGFRKLIKWISDRYGKPIIYVTENGTSLKGENDMTKDEILQDDFRAGYFRDYINALAEAVTTDGVDCRGYMAWSLMDNFEWAEGYETRFGVTFLAPLYIECSQSGSKEEKDMAFKEIPVLDLSEARSDTTKPAFLARLRDALLNVGFLYIKNTGISQELFDEVCREGIGFFDLPEEEKLRIEMKNQPSFLGYSRLGNEITAQKADWREQLDLSTPHALPKPTDPLYYNLLAPNQWPSNSHLPDFQPAFEKYMRQMSDVSMFFTSLIAEAIGLPSTAFNGFFDDDQQHKLKIVKYPDAGTGVGQGVGPHKDSMLTSYLLQATDHRGLQAQNTRGEWIDCPPIRGTLVVAIGQGLEALTGGVCASTTHRVLSPHAGTGARFSIPFFQGVSYDAKFESMDVPENVRRLRAQVLEGEGGRRDDVEFTFVKGKWGHLGEATLMNRVKSHPDVAERWYPGLLGQLRQKDQSNETKRSQQGQETQVSGDAATGSGLAGEPNFKAYQVVGAH